ncbi:hypothetical protein BaRGS_00035923 [Batillaria attramentaria]|uniref:Uncharacterized protein n=1 Tax=Batillaria attramentaria TaxID=370345 RepID=A0ABD0JD43_9CAEN
MPALAPARPPSTSNMQTEKKRRVNSVPVMQAATTAVRGTAGEAGTADPLTVDRRHGHGIMFYVSQLWHDVSENIRATGAAEFATVTVGEAVKFYVSHVQLS